MDFKCNVIIKYPNKDSISDVIDYNRGLVYDPVGTHMIELRNYYFRLKEHINEKLDQKKQEKEKLDQTKQEKEKLDQTKQETSKLKQTKRKIVKRTKRRRACYKWTPKKKVSKKNVSKKNVSKKNASKKNVSKKNVSEEKVSEKQDIDFTIPAAPKYYPYSDSLEAFSQNRTKTVLRFRGQYSKYEMGDKRLFFIHRILAQTGFHVPGCNKEAMDVLSDILDEFLDKFVKLVKSNKDSFPSSEGDDEWGPLETSLRECGIGGVSALHTFYYEDFVKKHDILLKESVDLHKQYQNLCDAKE